MLFPRSHPALHNNVEGGGESPKYLTHMHANTETVQPWRGEQPKNSTLSAAFTPSAQVLPLLPLL